MAGIAMVNMRITWFRANQIFEIVMDTFHPPSVHHGMLKTTGDGILVTEEGPPRPESTPFNPTMKNTRMKMNIQVRRTSFHSILARKYWVSEIRKSGIMMRKSQMSGMVKARMMHAKKMNRVRGSKRWMNVLRGRYFQVTSMD